jgi:hypothetical protein
VQFASGVGALPISRRACRGALRSCHRTTVESVISDRPALHTRAALCRGSSLDGWSRRRLSLRRSDRSDVCLAPPIAATEPRRSRAAQRPRRSERALCGSAPPRMTGHRRHARNRRSPRPHPQGRKEARRPTVALASERAGASTPADHRDGHALELHRHDSRPATGGRRPATAQDTHRWSSIGIYLKCPYRRVATKEDGTVRH